jgi:hypothetical protein
MEAQLVSRLAAVVLALHVGVVLFNVFGLIVIPLGAWRRWAFVRIFWWRALHLGILALVAFQAVLQRACLLTIWQSDLLRRAGEAASDTPLIQRWVMRIIFWPLPIWFFALLYIAICVYTLLLWRYVPPNPSRRTKVCR